MTLFYILLTVALMYFVIWLIPYTLIKIAQLIYFLCRGLKVPKKISPLHMNVLARSFPFYQALPFQKKKEFEYRVEYFLRSKDFEGRQGLVVTEEMKILVAASAVQLTFGFKPMQFQSFDKIILFPKAYYSRYTRGKHKGEMNPMGVIVFSWEDFLKGYSIPDDAYNLGLHEMAHALKYEDITPDDEYLFLDEEVLKEWNSLAEKEIYRIRTGENTYLRDYAGRNREEFFAVCVEHFFEQPELFKSTLPKVYHTLSQLLRQDTLKNNYSL